MNHFHIKKSHSDEFKTLYAKISSLDFKSLETAITNCGIRLSSNSFKRENWTLAEDNNTAIMQKMDLCSKSLEDYTGDGIKRGIVTGFNEAFIIDRFTRERLISEDPKSKEIIKQFIYGDDIRKYEINFKDKYIIFARRGIDILNYPAILRYLEQFREKLQPRKNKDAKVGRKPGNYKWYELQDTIDYYSDFEKSKIVYPDIGMSCRFALDENGFYPDTTSFEIPIRDLSLLAILNSKLIFYYISSLTPVLGDSNKGGRLRFKRVYLKNIPIRRISFTTPTEERARLGAELQDLYAQEKYDEILAVVQDCLPQDEAGGIIAGRERSDVVHDLLAYLAERMLEMNKAKQQEIRGFLGWLEGYVGAKVDDLTPKTKVQSYYEHDYESLLVVLKKNRKKLAIDPARREPGETLRVEFEGSMKKLGPLRERIKQTDELIDAVVYRLYGLTDEEIGIVEGGKN